MTSTPRLHSPYDVLLWESIGLDAMRLQRCTDCRAFRYPPGPICPDCLSVDFTWEPVAGTGRLLSWTTFHRQYLPAYPPPHTVVAVQLSEGPIMVGCIDRVHLPALRVDGSLRIVYADHADGYRFPVFVPDE